MPRYRLTVEYDGRPYFGFQAQKDQPSVQSALVRAIAAFSGEAVILHAAGRTDSGVHATGQVVHFDTERDWPAETVRAAVNAYLSGEAVVVLDAAVADADFHARFSAKGRRYLYRILNRPAPPALDKGRVWHVRGALDVDAINHAAQGLIGLHDFTTFRDAHCQSASPVKTLDVARAWRQGEEVRLSFEARSFLHRQVRSLTGSLVEVGLGRWTAQDLKDALDAKDRARCGQVAPAQGLYLVGVEY
ncbi:MAG TPA: tRNA pseudouridine(38-40) synthase TruA [Caulobacteraceae bacterium]|nr:tRNA pseudouridine(38-40) synthase TruA [Caulobacteraceae bacterium]